MPPAASYLNTNDVFVLKTPRSLWQWKGEGATQEEIGAAKHVAKILGGSVTEVEETKEPGECWVKKSLFSLQDNSVKYSQCATVFSSLSAGFWEALGGKGDYQTSKTLRNVIKPPRLFACSNKTGNLIVSIQRYGRMLV